MLDLFRLKLPIHKDYVLPLYSDDGRMTGGEVLNSIFEIDGVKVTSGELQINTIVGQDGSIIKEHKASKLGIPNQSIPSSNSTLAFCLYKGGKNYWPFIEIKASPAKLIQGHNVFGSDNVDVCAMSMLEIFFSRFDSDWFDYENIEISQIDITYTAHVANRFIAKQVIDSLSHISNGQVKYSKSYGTAVTFNEGSKHCMREIYLKEDEVLNQINKITKKVKKQAGQHWTRQLKALQSEVVQEFAKNAVRFEAKIRTDWFKQRAIPTNLIKFIHYVRDNENIIQNMWLAAFNPILETFQGETMNIYDDNEVLDALKRKYFTVHKNKVTHSKALRLMRFFRSIKSEGFQNVRLTTPDATFFRTLSDLCEVVPKAQLINLAANEKTNVIPLFKVVNIDFAKQLPAGFVEPVYSKLKLVV